MAERVPWTLSPNRVKCAGLKGNGPMASQVVWPSRRRDFWLLLMLAAIGPLVLLSAPLGLSLTGLLIASFQGLFLVLLAAVAYAISPATRRLDARKPLIVGALVLASLLGFGQLYGAKVDRQAEATAQQNNPIDPVPQQVTVLVSRQDGQGATEADMGPAFLEKLETYTASRMEELGNAAVAEGRAKSETLISTSSVYIEADGKRLAVLRFLANRSGEQLMIVGFAGSELVRVLCRDASGKRVPLAAGDCHDKVREIYGVSIAG